MARSRTKTTEPDEQVEPEGEQPAKSSKSDEGMGEHAYAGPRSDDAAAKPAEQTGGTREHLGDSPYAGSV
jgi:hypothetical protein